MPEPKKPKAPKAPAEAAGDAPAVSGGATPVESTPINTPAPAAEVAAPAASTEAPAKPAKAKTTKKKEAVAAAAVAEPKKEENLSLDPNAVVEPIKIIKAKGSKNVHTGIAHVLATFNNTIVSITDL